MNSKKIVLSLENELEEIGKEIILRNKYLNMHERKQFIKFIDSTTEHKPKWHQWGIITHSKKVRESYDLIIENYFAEEIQTFIDQTLNEQIQKFSKKNLLRISLPLHDIGKFMKKTYLKDNIKKFNFKNHELISKELILDTYIYNKLKQYGLSKSEIIYISECAARHYDLAHLREKTKKQNNYSLKYINSYEFKKTINNSLKQFFPYEIETGLLFLADNLGKNEIKIQATNDKEINEQKKQVIEKITQHKLNPNLLQGILQEPINTALVKKYLTILYNKNKKK